MANYFTSNVKILLKRLVFKRALFVMVAALVFNTLVFNGLAITGCDSSAKPEMWVISGPIMGTSYNVKVLDPPAGLSKNRVEKGVLDALINIDMLMSSYKDESELSRFNRFEMNQWFEVSKDTYAVIELAQEVSVLSEGSFDITVAPLIELWGFGARLTGDEVPSEKQSKEALLNVGYKDLLLDKRNETLAIKKRKAITLNLSAVAKGYAVDQVALTLDKYGINSYLVEVGGEIWAKGFKPNGEPWRIAVESPVLAKRAVQKIIDLTGVGVATSGDYRNYFEKDGVRYSHTIDPATGRPVQHNLVSVTVVDVSVAKADAWATALLVMGADRGMAAAKKNKLAVFFVVKNKDEFEESMTDSFKRYLSADG